MDPNLTHGIFPQECNRTPIGFIELKRDNQRPIRIEVSQAKLGYTMKTEVSPSYAVNPPYGNYDKTTKYTYEYWGPGKTEDIRCSNIEGHVRYALTKFGEYATESEIQKVVDIIPLLVGKIDLAWGLYEASINSYEAYYKRAELIQDSAYN